MTDEEEFRAYIDYLHARIESLEEELLEAERTALARKQERDRLAGTAATPVPDGGTNEGVETDIANISRYIRWIADEFETDRTEINQACEELVPILKTLLHGGMNPHNASLALWLILRSHEQLARDGD